MSQPTRRSRRRVVPAGQEYPQATESAVAPAEEQSVRHRSYHVVSWDRAWNDIEELCGGGGVTVEFTENDVSRADDTIGAIRARMPFICANGLQADTVLVKHEAWLRISSTASLVHRLQAEVAQQRSRLRRLGFDDPRQDDWYDSHSPLEVVMPRQSVRFWIDNLRFGVVLLSDRFYAWLWGRIRALGNDKDRLQMELELANARAAALNQEVQALKAVAARRHPVDPVQRRITADGKVAVKAAVRVRRCPYCNNRPPRQGGSS